MVGIHTLYNMFDIAKKMKSLSRIDSQKRYLLSGTHPNDFVHSTVNAIMEVVNSIHQTGTDSRWFLVKLDVRDTYNLVRQADIEKN